jgi:allantoate deiminase
VPISDESRVRTKTVIDRCRKLAGFSEQPGLTSRTFLSPPMHDCHQEIAEWLEPLGVDVKIDAAGNLRALYPGAEAGAPRLLLGSHLDTVPDAGAFDGALGVVLGVALLESLEGRRLPFGIEIVGFSEEEGVRFGTPFIGSRALVGRVDEELLRREDARGISVRAAIEDFGLKPAGLSGARLRGEILGYLEFHIEQGPVLDELGLPLGAVEAVAGQSKMEFTFFGRANHAGTTPMHLRRDSLAGAAEWIGHVEREANLVPGLVATVGTVEPKPGVTNVIARETRLTLDVRHRADEVRMLAVDRLIRAAEELAQRRELTLTQRTLLSQPSVPMDQVLVEQIEEAITQAGSKPHRMVSGAGHDAMILAEKVPAAMVFLRTPGGISHSPEETVEMDDVAKALETGSRLLELLAGLPARHGRVKRA